jgi:hypothetical protein
MATGVGDGADLKGLHIGTYANAARRFDDLRRERTNLALRS